MPFYTLWAGSIAWTHSLLFLNTPGNCHILAINRFSPGARDTHPGRGPGGYALWLWRRALPARGVRLPRVQGSGASVDFAVAMTDAMKRDFRVMCSAPAWCRLRGGVCEQTIGGHSGGCWAGSGRFRAELRPRRRKYGGVVAIVGADGERRGQRRIAESSRP
ncbi:hypothetical protein NBRC116599_06120 [Aquicoccus sp. SU-CL01552]